MVESWGDENDKLIKILEEEVKEWNREIEGLREEVGDLRKVLYGSKREE
nr:hypothetical protein [Paenibacillus bovis]